MSDEVVLAQAVAPEGAQAAMSGTNIPVLTTPPLKMTTTSLPPWPLSNRGVRNLQPCPAKIAMSLRPEASRRGLCRRSAARIWSLVCMTQSDMMCRGFDHGSWKWWTVLSFAVSIVACASDPIRDQVKQGRYLEAVQLCREATATNSRACEEARLQAIESNLAHLDRLGRDGHPASDLASLAALDGILSLSEPTQLAADSPTVSAIADRIARAREALSLDATRMANQPLAAEIYWEKRVPLLQHSPLREVLVAGVEETRTSGQRVCSRLTSDSPKAGPYQAALIHSYCAHFGEKVTMDTLDHGRADIVFQTKDLSSQQQGIVRERLVRALAQTPWLKSPVPTALNVAVDGAYNSVQTDQTVVLHGTYVDYHLTYPLVPGTGPLGVAPQTTDYPYEAVDHWRRYEANLRINVTFSDQAKPFVQTFNKGESLHGRDHHVTFEPAGIHPVHTTVPSADNWLALAFGAFAADFRAMLDEHWVQTYCKVAEYSTEDAARCLLAGQISEPVVTTIAQAIGEDAAAVPRLASGVAPTKFYEQIPDRNLGLPQNRENCP